MVHLHVVIVLTNFGPITLLCDRNIWS